MSFMESITRELGWWLIHMDMLLLLLVFVGIAVFFWWRKVWGKALLVVGACGLLFLATVPVGFWMLESLENRFPRPAAFPHDVTGVILLGGNFDIQASAGRGEAVYNMAAGRLIGFIKLARELEKSHPHVKLAFTGGGYRIPFQGEALPITEAELTQRELEALGFHTGSMIFEDQSRNTLENARLLKELIKPAPGEKWVLVTSAFHMPRSVGLFEKEGWHVIPYPVDYHTGGQGPFFLGLEVGLMTFSAGVREWVSMIQNYLYGRSDSLYPG